VACVDKCGGEGADRGIELGGRRAAAGVDGAGALLGRWGGGEAARGDGSRRRAPAEGGEELGDVGFPALVQGRGGGSKGGEYRKQLNIG